MGLAMANLAPNGNVCLVGGGQEINTGEAGITEWIKAINKYFTHWKLYTYILELAATEIQVQGLEVDYACVIWDAAFWYNDREWSFCKFNGHKKWTPERNQEAQRNMLNAYRVLLTRTRQGIVICIPPATGA